jgi:hypothetical protein
MALKIGGKLVTPPAEPAGPMQGTAFDEDFKAAHEKELANLKQPPKAEQLAKTVVIWCESPSVRFFIVDGDLSHLNQQFMGGNNLKPGVEQQVFDLMYVESGTGRKRKPSVSMVDKFPVLAVIGGAKVIVTGDWF